jgi:hypothetical protein
MQYSLRWANFHQLTNNQLLWPPSEPNSIAICRRCRHTSILPYKPKGKVWLSVHRTARSSERPNSNIRRSCTQNVALTGKKHTNCVYSQVHLMQYDSLVRFSGNSNSLENFVNNSDTEFYDNFDTNSLVTDRRTGKFSTLGVTLLRREGRQKWTFQLMPHVKH